MIIQWKCEPDTRDGVITHLEPDILVCEVRWALESITMNKASGGDGIRVDTEGQGVRIKLDQGKSLEHRSS